MRWLLFIRESGWSGDCVGGYEIFVCNLIHLFSLIISYMLSFTVLFEKGMNIFLIWAVFMADYSDN